MADAEFTGHSYRALFLPHSTKEGDGPDSAGFSQIQAGRPRVIDDRHHSENWRRGRDSNPRPPDYGSGALGRLVDASTTPANLEAVRLPLSYPGAGPLADP